MEEVFEAIREDPTHTKKARSKPADAKSWKPRKLTYDQRKAALKAAALYKTADLAAKRAEFEWSDGNALPGCQPYYVRLTQVDGARAWSSPFYIHCEG